MRQGHPIRRAPSSASPRHPPPRAGCLRRRRKGSSAFSGTVSASPAARVRRPVCGTRGPGQVRHGNRGRDNSGPLILIESWCAPGASPAQRPAAATSG